MAWTTPASYSVGEVVTASKLNTHVRDNLRYLKGLDGAFSIDAQMTAPRIIITPSLVSDLTFTQMGDTATNSTQLDIARTSSSNGSIQIDSFLSGVGGAPLLLNSRFNGAVNVANNVSAGIFHAKQGPGGFVVFGASALSTTPVTVISSGISRRVSGFITAWHSGGTGGGTQFNAASGTTAIYNDGTNIVSITLSAGQLTIFRSAGSGTFDVTLMITYQ